MGGVGLHMGGSIIHVCFYSGVESISYELRSLSSYTSPHFQHLYLSPIDASAALLPEKSERKAFSHSCILSSNLSHPNKDEDFHTTPAEPRSSSNCRISSMTSNALALQTDVPLSHLHSSLHPLKASTTIPRGTCPAPPSTVISSAESSRTSWQQIVIAAVKKSKRNRPANHAVVPCSTS